MFYVRDDFIDTGRVFRTLEMWSKIEAFVYEVCKGDNGEYKLWFQHAVGVQWVVWDILASLKYSKVIDLNSNDMMDIAIASSLHDIGKLAIPMWILNKKSSLSCKERKFIQLHVRLGAYFIEELLKEYKGYEIFRISRDIAEYHHENWDGSGYLKGLKGEEIPIYARVCAIADNYAALVEDRPYRDRLAHREAIEVLRRDRGTKFDPVILDAFVRYNGETELVVNKGFSFVDVVVRSLVRR